MKRYEIDIYTSRNTTRRYHGVFFSLKDARSVVKASLCRDNLYAGEDFHGNPLQRSKVAIFSGSYPSRSYELWEFMPSIDKSPKKTEWSK